MPDDAPQNSDQPDETALLRAELAAAEARIAALEQIIKGLQRARFGQSSERVEAGQLALELGRAPLTLEPANDTTAKPRDNIGNGQRRRNRGALPAHLERIEEVLDLADQGCPCCGVAMCRIGEDRSERLDVVPAQLRVRVTIRPRYACRRCEEGVRLSNDIRNWTLGDTGNWTPWLLTPSRIRFAPQRPSAEGRCGACRAGGSCRRG